MTRSIERQLIDGVWTTLDADESGGEGLVTESGNYSGSNVVIANNDSAAVTWDTLDAGDDIIDTTNPALPVVRKAGLFMAIIP